jgi:hypothetical protein
MRTSGAFLPRLLGLRCSVAALLPGPTAAALLPLATT